MPSECTEHLQKLLGSAYSHLSSNEQIILGTAFLEGAVTNTRLQSILELRSTEIGRILAGLVERNMLIADRKGRWTSYRLNEDYVISPEQIHINDLPVEDALIRNNTDRTIYEYIKTNGFITTHQILEITDIGTLSGASFALGRLMKANIVEKVREGRHFIYKLK